MLGLVLISTLYTLALMPTSALFPLMSMSILTVPAPMPALLRWCFPWGFYPAPWYCPDGAAQRTGFYTIIGSFLLMSFSLFVSGMLPKGGFAIFVICSWLMGVSGPFYWGIYTPLLQSNFEAKYLGRVLSLSSSIRLIERAGGIVTFRTVRRGLWG